MLLMLIWLPYSLLADPSSTIVMFSLAAYWACICGPSLVFWWCVSVFLKFHYPVNAHSTGRRVRSLNQGLHFQDFTTIFAYSYRIVENTSLNYYRYFIPLHVHDSLMSTDVLLIRIMLQSIHAMLIIILITKGGERERKEGGFYFCAHSYLVVVSLSL